jgi:hypothetical protein
VELYRQFVDTIVAELGMEWVYRAIKVMALWDEAPIISSIDWTSTKVYKSID